MPQLSPSAIVSKLSKEASLFDTKDRLLNFSVKGDFQSPLMMEAGDTFYEKWIQAGTSLPIESFFPITEKFTIQQKKTAVETFYKILQEKQEDFGHTDLYLLIGFLKWDGNALAPSLLVPVEADLSKKTLSLSNAPVIENVILRERLKDITKLPKASDFLVNGTFDIQQYLTKFEASIAVGKNWKFTRRGFCLGFFNTIRYLLKNSLEKNWADKKIDSNPILSSLLHEGGFELRSSLFEDNEFDKIFTPCDHHFLYTVDSHTSKATIDAMDPSACAYAIQALPGTAKMKVVANIVADTIAQNKNVLVVSRRTVTAHEFQNAWKPPFRTFPNVDRDSIVQELAKARKDFSDYYDTVNKPIPPSGVMLSDLLDEFIKAKPPKFKFPESIFQGISALGLSSFRDVKRIIAELTGLCLQKNGIQARSAFKGVNVPSLTPEQKEKLAKNLNEAASQTTALTPLIQSLEKTGLFPTGIFLAGLADIFDIISENFGENTPTYEEWPLRDNNWEIYKDTLLALPKAADKWINFRRQNSEIYTDTAVDENILSAYRDFVASQKNALKGLSDLYRSSKKRLLEVIRHPREVRSDVELTELIEALLDLQENKKAYKESAVLGNHLLGKDWLYERSNWEELGNKIKFLYDFRESHKKDANLNLLLQILEHWHLFKDLLPKFAELKQSIQSLQRAVREISRDMNLDVPLESKSIEKWQDSIKSWSENWDSLDIHLKITELYDNLEKINCGDLAQFLNDPDNMTKAGKEILQAIEYHWAGSQIQAATRIFPELFSLTPKNHAEKVKEYREILDRFCNANFKELHDTLEKDPSKLTSASLAETFSFSENRHFDLAIILDADCISLVESIPTFLTTEKVILVGDPHYPTIENLPLDAFQEEALSHIVLFHDSILSSALRQGIPTRELWLSNLYSDASLVHFANQRIYNHDIKQLPVPNREKFQGIRFKVVENKVISIAQAAIRHAEKNPGKTLGIIAFHQSTCEEIESSIRALITAGTATARFFDQQNPDIRYYVKTPERAAGRYRDVVLICAESEGSGTRNNDNKIAVCTTTAKSELHVFLSTSDQAKQAGAKKNLFWDWIAYLQSRDFSESVEPRAAVSVIRDSIMDTLKKENFQIEESFSKGGIAVGPVVVDANNENRFLALIEDDCTTERFSESVEDRVYIRPTVLKQSGWKLFMLWLPFWYMGNADEVSHLVTSLAIEQSIAPPPRNEQEIEEDELDLSEIEGPQVVAYQVQHPKIEGTPHDRPIAELPIPALITQLKFYVDHESPIHEEILKQRVLELHHVDRAGPVLQQVLNEALNQGLQKKRFVKTGPFYNSLTPHELLPRNREARPDFERKLAFVGPEERALMPTSMDEHALREALGLLE